ncbi:hypothetical protein [Paenarthrobacter aurescens]|nr:hypothetical protein [Paenarthrobacter aurescens]MDO6143061.1 hypothetical protein [Paenarthrobacter aurescens]MDO6146906.1 hypothetical protein [Paenarthrobacter aurescens]MDO6158152.1 hypothetical protein [Paenarthrobacter aurescens]MDO6162137.1 hypothetical protein [Paenarthrobacter aurescens]
MNKNAMRGLAVSGLLVMGLTACGGAGTSTEAASAPASETATPTPTPAATSEKQYTLAELTTVLGQIKDKQGTKLSVMSSADMSGTMEQTKAIMAQTEVQPAACRDIAMGSLAQPTTGVEATFGVSQDVASGSISSISLSTGLEKGALEKAQQSLDQVSECSTMTVSAPTGSSTVTLTDLAGKKPANALFVYRVDTELASGEKGSVLMSQAVKHDVLVSVIATGGSSEDAAMANLTSLLDQAVELIK